MYETKRKVGFSWDGEVTVNISLKELAVLYSVMCFTSTREANDRVDKAIVNNVGVYENDLAYKVYDDLQEILKNHGVELKA
jgi:hypothetical protein